jgi:hypothetical protein
MTEMQHPLMTKKESDRKIHNVNKSAEFMVQNLVDLYEGRAWVRQGYQNWAELCDARLAPARASISRLSRKAKAIELAQEGMSGEAIAGALGVSAMTVSRDLTEADVHRDEVMGLDGRRQTPNQGRKGRRRKRTKLPEFPVDTVVGYLLGAAHLVEHRAVRDLSIDELRQVAIRYQDALQVVRQWQAAVGLAEAVTVIEADDDEPDDED